MNEPRTPQRDVFIKTLERLVESFERDTRQMREQGYPEASLRVEYLDPLFDSLGWDTSNRHGAPLHLREVIVENKTEEEKGRQKRVDYTFRINGLDKWVCEAKKPFDNISRHFYQPQYYAYNLRLWIAILCDFEHLIVFVVGGKPSQDRPFSPAWRAHYTQYCDLAEQIWQLLSREAVENGSLERFIQALPKAANRKARQGWLIKPDRSRTIDADFLRFLEAQRATLALALIRANPEATFTSGMLGDCVQRILDRLLFQRICEDRDIDVGQSLDTILRHWEQRGRIDGQLWPQVVGNFRHIARTFNGGLFGKDGEPPHPSDRLHVPDRWIIDFIDEVSDDNSPYLFSTIPVEILGSVYERFLSSIVLDNGKVELKPDLRKAEGVYYTPRFVVNAIVEETLGRYLQESDQSTIQQLKILDPACGSGSFLLAAFERICLHYVDKLTRHAELRHDDQCFLFDGDLHLTTAFKRKLLLDHIFGVDIDPLAVEVTQMSLYLKVLEGETKQSLVHDLRLFPKERLLPDLSNNIRCGNSIVATDVYPEYCDADDITRLRPFTWADEFRFLKRRKFTLVVGNPPWGGTLQSPELAYCREKYAEAISRMVDTYIYFVYRALQLLDPRGALGFVLPTTFLNQVDAAPIRKIVLKRGIALLADLGQGVFGRDATNTASVVVARSMLSSGSIKLKNLSQMEPLVREKSLTNYTAVGYADWLKAVASDPHSTFFVAEFDLPRLLNRLRADPRSC
jgi:hypothetical protein